MTHVHQDSLDLINTIFTKEFLNEGKTRQVLLSDSKSLAYNAEMFPVGQATGRTTLRAADVNCVGSHSTPLSTNKFLEAL